MTENKLMANVSRQGCVMGSVFLNFKIVTSAYENRKLCEKKPINFIYGVLKSK